MSTNKYICIHGHFYQPPRENAWLETIEIQDSAAPYHDWNERINSECYAPNTAARILDDEQRIVNILNNYAYMSFNFGPTLLSWMEKADPSTYTAILEADRQSRELFGGHGSALAQVHSHLILPLANERDKQTQVAWGIRDFAHRFGRQPEGIWLSETAVDEATLEVLAKQGIKFTILAPRQAKSIRPIGADDWQELAHAAIDPRRPYRCHLESGRYIDLFFYHGEVSQAVAFERLLDNGRAFANRLSGSFDNNEEPQLLHIATDGESYGHHHPRGEMALAFCMNEIMERQDVSLTNYGQYLELFPPEWEVKIWNDSSWSCVHGVGRWQENCGCNSGGHPSWNQEWRKPLRDTLNWLRDELIPIYEAQAAELLTDPWAARNDYIEVLLHDHKPEVMRQFFAKHASRELTDPEKTQLLRMLEMQRHSMLMFTSCGWFFDEISGLETTQILQYANRAIHYARQVAAVDLHPAFITRLENTPSNLHEHGAINYIQKVIPARVNLERVGMHFAAASLFAEHPEELELFNYVAESEALERYHAGVQRLATGRTKVRSRITWSEKEFSFAVLYLGQQNIIGAISTDMPKETFDLMTTAIVSAFSAPNLGEVITLMHRHFGIERYSIWHLFRDERRRIIEEITQDSLRKAQTYFREIYDDNYQLMTGISNIGMPIPDAYQNAVAFVLNRDLQNFFTPENNSSIRELRRVVAEFEKWQVSITQEDGLKLRINNYIFRSLHAITTKAEDQNLLVRMIRVLEAVRDLYLAVDYWKTQNLYFSRLQTYEQEDWEDVPETWKEAFLELGKLLRVKVPEQSKVSAQVESLP